MGYTGKSYRDYLRTSGWKAFAKRYREQVGRCQTPRCDRPPFAVHHLCYDHVDLSNPGTEPSEDLLVLCKECHFLEHPSLHRREKAIERVWHVTPYLDKHTGELFPCVRPGYGGDMLNPKTEELTVRFGRPVDYMTAFEKVQSFWGDLVRPRADVEAEIDRLFGEPPPGKKRVVLTLAAHATL